MLSTSLRAAAGTALAIGLIAAFSGPVRPQAGALSMTPAAAAVSAACAFRPHHEQGAKDVGTPPATPPYAGMVQATLKTNLGELELALDGAKAPCTVNSFTYLAQRNFFDKTHCHRLTTGALKVLQCGDPTGTGSGGPAYTYGDENLPKPSSGRRTAIYAKGTVAMANAGPGTTGSQFFMVYGDSELPPKYTAFGKMTSGVDLLEQVAMAGTDNINGEGDGAPKKTVTIEDVVVGGHGGSAAR